jgi:hypothetical protein
MADCELLMPRRRLKPAGSIHVRRAVASTPPARFTICNQHSAIGVLD